MNPGTVNTCLVITNNNVRWKVREIGHPPGSIYSYKTQDRYISQDIVGVLIRNSFQILIIEKHIASTATYLR